MHGHLRQHEQVAAVAQVGRALLQDADVRSADGGTNGKLPTREVIQSTRGATPRTKALRVGT
eukprot:7222854-Prymnesium_polylepis.1